jgi:hypothetical protein
LCGLTVRLRRPHSGGCALLSGSEASSCSGHC